MIFKLLGVVFFIGLFLFIACSIVKDMVRERKKLDGKLKKAQPEDYKSYYNHNNNEKVVHLKNRRRTAKTMKRGER